MHEHRIAVLVAVALACESSSRSPPSRRRTCPASSGRGSRTSARSTARIRRLPIVASARLGYPGTVIWDLLPGKYNATCNEQWSLLGPAPDFQPRPGYFLLRLVTATTEPGWRIVAVDGAAGGKARTAYDGAGGTTVVGLARLTVPQHAVWALTTHPAAD